MTPLDEQFRAVGFTGNARNYPRDDLALAMFAAFNGVTVEQLPEAMRYFPNEATARAWKRVADAARVYHSVQSVTEVAANNSNVMEYIGQFENRGLEPKEFEAASHFHLIEQIQNHHRNAPINIYKVYETLFDTVRNVHIARPYPIDTP